MSRESGESSGLPLGSFYGGNEDTANDAMHYLDSDDSVDDPDYVVSNQSDTDNSKPDVCASVVASVTKIVADYRQSLYSGAVTPESSNYAEVKSQTHLRSAKELLELCCVNGGAFVKVGQHLGSLEYLLPTEYVSTMKVLHSSAPQSSLNDIYQVIQEELKCEPQELFIEFDPEPLGAASLAQVHRARLKDGREVAVKVQHPTVKAHSRIDMKGMELLVGTVSLIFPEFNFEWLVEEMKKNLPKELDFAYEARNAEKVAAQFSHFPWLKIPAVDWNLTTDRVLVMEFCQGGQVNDRTYMLNHNINTKEVSEKLGHLYSEMIFVNGYVHCDPHPGNVLVQKVGNKAQIILLDHGLYTNLTNDFRLKYSKLWMSILNADLDSIQKYGNQLGVGELYGLFACMVTGRSWNSISQGIDKTKRTYQEQDEIKSDVAKYLPEISSVLNRVPRQMLLIFKTNDLLRGIEFSLNTQESMKSFLTMWRCCVRCVFSHQKTLCNSAMCSFKVSLSESWANLKISLYTFYLVCLHSELVGQHLGSLEYLIPMEYVNTLKVLHSHAPQSSLEDILRVIQEELNCEPEQIFKKFDPEPVGAASLAQVHRAWLKDGREVAVKVQHPTVKAHSKVDMKTMDLLVRMVSYIFPEFKFEWLWLSILNADLKSLEEIASQLGVGENAIVFSCMITGRSWNSVVQGIHKTKRTSQEREKMRSDVSTRLPEISSVLSSVPREMLLLLKTNDLLRSVEFSLNEQHSMKSFLTMWECCVQSVYSHQRRKCNSNMCLAKVSVA
ncbi:hypothetical protein Pcinc_009209 [Petrolisthes cinctipes]|uniref:Protein kinase domain-containing protein n=1 Tax=Petrolisthes cinctipes TaxID=88211 RepID=A0AAE1G7E9_PETCI|nr:hypothetical protein Pcinc_009209 [Petrolisthes cinctipes]